jgi:hypothetical protein
MKYVIEKDKYLNTWIVWEIQGNAKIDRFRGLKRDCNKWIKETLHN